MIFWSFYNAYTFFSEMFSGGVRTLLTERSHQILFFRYKKKSKIIVSDAKILNQKQRSAAKIIFMFFWSFFWSLKATTIRHFRCRKPSKTEECYQSDISFSHVFLILFVPCLTISFGKVTGCLSLNVVTNGSLTDRKT